MVCDWAVAGDGDCVWVGPGVGCVEGRAGGCSAERSANDIGGDFTAPEGVGGAAGGAVICTAGGSGAVWAGLNRLENTDMKLDARNRYMVHINPQAAGYSQSQLEALYRTMEERFHALPRVVKVGIASYTPMEDNNNGWGWQVQGQPNLTLGASYVKANADYFDSVGTRVVMGRGVGVQDTSTAPPVAVVNEAFVKKFLGSRNPLGSRIGTPDSPGNFEVVGVVEDTIYQSVRWKTT